MQYSDRSLNKSSSTANSGKYTNSTLSSYYYNAMNEISSIASSISNTYQANGSYDISHYSNDSNDSYQYRNMQVAKKLKQIRPAPTKKRVPWSEEELNICQVYYNDIYSVNQGFDLYSQFLKYLDSNEPIGPYDCPIKSFAKSHLTQNNIKQGFKNLGLKAVPKGPTPRPKSDPALRTIWTEEEKAILQEYHTIFKKSRNVESSIYQGFLQWINLEEQQYKKSKFPAGHIANEKRIRHGFRIINVQSTDLKQSVKLYNESSDDSSDETMVTHVMLQRVVRGEGNHSK
jgi:hypothetical protein